MTNYLYIKRFDLFGETIAAAGKILEWHSPFWMPPSGYRSLVGKSRCYQT